MALGLLRVVQLYTLPPYVLEVEEGPTTSRTTLGLNTSGFGR